MIRSFVILICLSLSSVLAQQKQTQAKEKALVTQHNFLFIIESSLSMAPRKAAMVQMVRNMIVSGFEKQIQSGDSIDIWTYDEENRISGFPPQIWEEAESKRIAADAAQFVGLLEFNGRGHFEVVARDLEALLPNAKRLLIVLITDGNELLSGIPLDLDLNEFVANEKRRRPDPKQPFLISIATANGKYIQWSAYCDESDHVLANLPPRVTPQSKPQPKSQPQVATARPKEAKASEKKREDKPILFELPPGARLASPPPAPKIEPPTPTVAPNPATNVATSATNATTNQLARSEPPVNEVKKQSEPPKVVATAAPTVTTASTAPSQTTPPVVHQAVQPTVQPSIQQPLTQPAQLVQPIQKTEPTATPPVQVANVTPKPATNHIEPQTQSHPAQSPDSNVVAVAAAPPVAPQPRPVHPPLPETISLGAIFGGLTLAGFAIIILAGLLLLKRGAKARQGGSIISRSLQL